jgi:hypothetical protein
MGLFFERTAASPQLVALMTSALKAEPPQAGNVPTEAALFAAKLDPLVTTLSTALNSPPPQDVSAAATKYAQSVVNELLGGPSFNTGRFVLAFLIFTALIGGGIATEATHLTTASGTLFGFAGAIFGIVTAFLGTEKGTS